MSAPKKVRRDYGKSKDGAKRPGVTTVIGSTLGFSKNGLMMWAAGEAAKAAVHYVIDEGAAPEAAIERARKAHLIIRDEAADAGKLAHEYVEAYLRHGTMPHEDVWGEESETEKKARAAFRRFRAWWPTSGYEVEATELPLVDETHDYGGTIDLVLRRKADGVLLVGDLKTGKSIYEEVSVQLGAYSLLLGLHGRHVQGGLVLHSPVDGDFRAIPVSLETLQAGAGVFAALLSVHRVRPFLEIEKVAA